MDVIKPVAGGLAWAIAAALQVVPQLWPESLKPHPWIVVGFVSMGAGMFIYATLKGHRRSPPSTSIAGVNSSGVQINAVGDVYYGNNEVAAPKSKPGTRDSTNADLRILNPKAITAYIEGDIWQEGHGEEIIVLPVENPTAKLGHSSISVSGVVATVRLSMNGSVVGSVDRAYWVSYAQNMLTIDVGQTRHIVLGSGGNHKWCFYSNPIKYLRHRARTFTEWAKDSEDEGVFQHEIATGDVLEFDVKVLSLPNGTTLAHALLRVTGLSGVHFQMERLL